MPIKVCRTDNKPGFQWGNKGKCFTYTANNDSSRERARNRAAAQGRAIAAQGSEKKKGFWSNLFKDQYEK